MSRGRKPQDVRQAKTLKQPKPAMKEQTSDIIFALDIGTRSIIGMLGKVEDGKVKVIALERENHAERSMMDGQIENIEKVADIAGRIKERLEKKSRIRLRRVCVAAAGRALRTEEAGYELNLPGTQLIDDEIISRLEVGAISRAEEAFEAENADREDSRRFYLVGYTVRQYFLDQYTISSLKDHRGQNLKVDLIATFLPSEVVESLYTTMTKIGLEVASLTLEPIAAINAAIPENIRLLNLVMVDIGAGTSDIAVCTDGSITGYTMATVAGDEITETLMKQYLVDFPTAENIKIQLADEEELTFFNILGMEQKASAKDLFQSIRGTMEALSKEIADKVVELNGKAPSALFLVGGGSKLAGLKDGIADALGMDQNRVTLAGNYFQTQAFSEEYDLNNPEYATPIGIMVSSGLNLINDSFRVTLNGKPAKLFRNGSFTALNLLMMNGYNFRDIMGRSGANLSVIVNGTRKIFYGTASDPAALFINRKEGKLSDVIHAGDLIEFSPARNGSPGHACLGDIEGVSEAELVTLNGKRASMKTELKNGDVVFFQLPEKEKDEQHLESTDVAKDIGKPENIETPEAAAMEESSAVLAVPEGQENAGISETSAVAESAVIPFASEGRENAEISEISAMMDGSVVPPASERRENTEASKISAMKDDFVISAASERQENTESLEKAEMQEENGAAPVRETADKTILEAREALKPGSQEPRREEMLHFMLNDSELLLHKKEDGRPYYLMDLIQHSGINLDSPKGQVKLQVNGEDGRFQQVLKEGDHILIFEDTE